MEKVRIGIIGLGNMGTNHAKSIAGGLVPGMEVAAAADLKEDRRAWAAENLPGAALYPTGEALIAAGGVDAVLIAVPHYQHPELAIQAFEAGLHVMCEKPAGVYTKQVRPMNAAAEKSGKVFGMMFNQRTNCLYRKMHEMVESGELGAVKRVSWIITDWYRPQCYYDSGDWRATWAGEGGGVLMNQSPHQLDLLQWICGMPVRVRAFCHVGKWHNIEVEDDATLYMEFPSGATGTFVTCTADAPGTNRLELTCEMGKLICEDGKLTLYKLEENERVTCNTVTNAFAAPAYTVSEVETDGLNEQHVGVLKAFTGAILRGEPLVADGREGIHQVALANAAYLSSWLDETVELPFDEDLYLAELDVRRAASRIKTGPSVVYDTSGSYGS